VITPAMLRLRSAPTRVRLLQLRYAERATFAEDARVVVRHGRFDECRASSCPASPAARTCSRPRPRRPPARRRWLTGLHDIRDLAVFSDMTYEAFVKRLDPIVGQQRQAGVWEFPHPLFDVWLPDAQAARQRERDS
jgi:hypothetical protein